ncbi:MAG: UDP-3-O-(3-hydroxymyristoyl)glucosamine N-acyltransferase [Victivallales bacterium]|nr:UDP-3-O-(3-hydroxymyristoyl)glucosamine N-acyltransferase [Victivallales bacterium]
MLISKNIEEIAALVGGSIIGNYHGDLTGVSSLKEAMCTDVAFLGNEKYISQVLPSKAGVVLVPPSFQEEPPEGRAWIVCGNPSAEFSKVVTVFTPEAVKYEPGIHERACVADGAMVAADASVGACAVISKGARIGARTVICPGVFVGENAIIGEDCLIYPNVTIRERCVLGNRVTLHAGVVIGADGFGYDSGPQGHVKVPQVGIVQIDDDVEVGANSTIDRARFGRTWIRQGTKIDNLVQVGHNVQVGRGCLLVAQCGVSGSTVLGDGVILAGQAGVVGHLNLGDGTIVMAQAGVTKDSAQKSILFGSPAQDRRDYARQMVHIGKIEGLLADVKALKDEIAELKKKD